ncbi:hypothetical protein FE391_43460 [Nonomuraea sp. KC401]|uniref:hypothetical protein n=1 Tax=unclassified Nonomuraea TaxID=2593643 RepID=UPI0010FE94FA|nr:MULTISPECIES: hypothetical protein [unclassified Nonomuraea]NBF00218.1 hypothetical protein [Nonomuraea sp. K271]TLF52465.1 hypothetical protein FE391_43460 [Nonomuraea sp. KC401]
MKILVRPHQIPPRLAAAAVILNSGLSKSGADEDTAASLHGMASGTYPFLRKVPPSTFTKLLSKTEVTLGVALLVPLVPSFLAGAALTGFAAGLLGLYLKTPGLRQEGSLRPTEQGIAIAKDVWLLGIGLGLVAEEMRDHRP